MGTIYIHTKIVSGLWVPTETRVIDGFNKGTGHTYSIFIFEIEIEDSGLIGPTKLKNSFTNLFFSYPPISLELLIPQKWFTYQYLHK